jgi:predicted TIM-barrel fold metal-dependent hydrolase
MVDPGREVGAQLRLLEDLERRYPIYGIKVAAVDCQSKVTSLIEEGKPFLDFAAERDLPFLLHTTADPSEQYSHASLCFEVIDANPHLRFCLAHCIGFHAEYLRRADAMPNVWVDCSALKIQVQCARENNQIIAPEGDRLAGDYSDHTKILNALMAQYPGTMIWGSDSPWYTFICRRKQGEGSYTTFRLKGRYEDEKAALDSLPEDLRTRACNTNTLKFLFGD